jgi:hypothetical protein
MGLYTIDVSTDQLEPSKEPLPVDENRTADLKFKKQMIKEFIEKGTFSTAVQMQKNKDLILLMKNFDVGL